jgi:hypothetical protein
MEERGGTDTFAARVVVFECIMHVVGAHIKWKKVDDCVTLVSLRFLRVTGSTLVNHGIQSRTITKRLTMSLGNGPIV